MSLFIHRMGLMMAPKDEPAIPTTLTYHSRWANAGSNGVFTFNPTPIGLAYSGRQVVICVSIDDSSYNANDISGVTFNGSPMTRFGTTAKTSSGSTSAASGIYIASAPSGSSANIVVTALANSARYGIIHTYLAKDISAEAVDELSFSANGSGTVNTVALGQVIGVAQIVVGGATCTWTGLTEDNSGQILFNLRAAAASAPTPSGGSRSVGMTWSSTSRMTGKIVSLKGAPS